MSGFAVVVSALLFSWAFPPVHLHALAWVALVPLLVVLRTARRLRNAVAAAGAWGMLAAWTTTDWLPPTLETYYHQPYWLGFALFATAAFLMGAVEYMAFAACYRTLAARRPALAPLVAGAAWAVAELGRDTLLTGNPWGLLGYSQTPLPVDASGAGAWLAAHVVQVADLGGVYAVGFVLAAANAAIAELLLAARASIPSEAAPAPARLAGGQTGGFAALRGVAGVAVLLLAMAGYGEFRLREEPATTEARSVVVVQADVELGSQWDPTFYGLNLAEHLELTLEALRDHGADLVIWPENAMTFFVDREPAYRRSIATALTDRPTPILAGAPRHSDDSPVRYFNSAVLLDPHGEVTAVYDKQHLLPFAEYFPLGSNGILRRNFGRVREFSAGSSAALLPSPLGPLGMLICNEAMFPRLARERALDGAQVLVNLSNDSWVGSVEFAEHQLAIASMRAIEQRRYLVRASTWGPSAIVDPLGFVRERTATDTATTLRGEVRPQQVRTAFRVVGDWPVLAAALWLAVLMAQRRPREVP